MAIEIQFVEALEAARIEGCRLIEKSLSVIYSAHRHDILMLGRAASPIYYHACAYLNIAHVIVLMRLAIDVVSVRASYKRYLAADSVKTSSSVSLSMSAFLYRSRRNDLTCEMKASAKCSNFSLRAGDIMSRIIFQRPGVEYHDSPIYKRGVYVAYDKASAW